MSVKLTEPEARFVYGAAERFAARYAGAREGVQGLRAELHRGARLEFPWYEASDQYLVAAICLLEVADPSSLDKPAIARSILQQRLDWLAPHSLEACLERFGAGAPGLPPLASMCLAESAR